MVTSPSLAPKALIIGCGVGGPALAIALHKAGIQSEIYERQDNGKDNAGAWLNVMPNGLSVLQTLGVDTAVRAAGYQNTDIVFHDNNGRRLAAMPSPGVSVRRSVVHQVLRDEAQRVGVPIYFGKRLTDIATGPDGGVSATFHDGTTAAGAYLIGCDGIHSTTRAVIFPQAQRPRYIGMVESVGFGHTTTLPPSTGALNMFWGKQSFFCYLVRQDGEAYWFETLAMPKEPGHGELAAISHDDWRNQLYAANQGDDLKADEIIASTSAPIGRYPLYTLPPLATWHSARVCLMGDAAHAISPHAGQGSSLALEDALILAQCLRDLPELVTAFTTFEAIRRPRVERVAHIVRNNDRCLVGASPVARFMRNRLIPVVLKGAIDAGPWMYEYTIDWDDRLAA